MALLDDEKDLQNEPIDNDELIEDLIMEEGLFDELNDDQLNQFNKAVEKLYHEEDRDIAAMLKTADDSEKDIDAQLEELINQAKNQKDDELDDSGGSRDFFSDVSVYEGESRSNKALHDDDAPIKKIADPRVKGFARIVEKINALSFGTLLITLIVLAILSISLFIFSLINMGTMNNIAEENPEQNVDGEASPGVAVIKQEAGTNSSNFVFIKQSKMLDKDPLVLVKMLTDGLATVFYFDKTIDPQKYYVSLRDNDNNVYALDNTFQNNSKDEIANSVFRFEPLLSGTKSFDLSVYNKTSGEVASFGLTFERPTFHAEAKYIDEPISISDEDDNAFISGAEFSSTGSTIYFDLGSNAAGESIRLSDSPGESVITMNEGTRKIIPNKILPNLYEFEDNQTIGRMDFLPLKDLNSKITVVFTNLLKTVELNQDVNIEQLFLNQKEYEKTISVGEQNIVLERAGLMGGYYVVVLHAEDSPSSAQSKGREIERTEVRLDAELVVKTTRGDDVIIKGDCRSSKRGSDILFKIPNDVSLLGFAPQETAVLRINNALFKLDESKVEIDLSKAKNEMSKSVSLPLRSIIRSFEQRLAVKANRAPESGLTGFSNTVLNNAELNSAYNSLADLTDSMYSANVLAYGLNNSQLFAVVTETLTGSNGEKELVFVRTHKITAEFIDGDWVITNDIILDSSLPAG